MCISTTEVMRIGQIDTGTAQHPDMGAAEHGVIERIRYRRCAEGATMAKRGTKLTLALEAESRAHQQLVNISEELKTVYMAGQEPDDDEMMRLHQAYAALLGAARAVYAAVGGEQAMSSRKRCAA
jgi:hypothetical protein